MSSENAIRRVGTASLVSTRRRAGPWRCAHTRRRCRYAAGRGAVAVSNRTSDFGRRSSRATSLRASSKGQAAAVAAAAMRSGSREVGADMGRADMGTASILHGSGMGGTVGARPGGQREGRRSCIPRRAAAPAPGRALHTFARCPCERFSRLRAPPERPHDLRSMTSDTVASDPGRRRPPTVPGSAHPASCSSSSASGSRPGTPGALREGAGRSRRRRPRAPPALPRYRPSSPCRWRACWPGASAPAAPRRRRRDDGIGPDAAGLRRPPPGPRPGAHGLGRASASSTAHEPPGGGGGGAPGGSADDVGVPRPLQPRLHRGRGGHQPAPRRRVHAARRHPSRWSPASGPPSRGPGRHPAERGRRAGAGLRGAARTRAPHRPPLLRGLPHGRLGLDWSGSSSSRSGGSTRPGRVSATRPSQRP